MRSDKRGDHDRDHLTQQYGPLVGGGDLAQVLGFQTTAALRQARRRGKISLRTFRIEGRQGLFALTADVSAWLAEIADSSCKIRPADGGDVDPLAGTGGTNV
jgi:hypothetical protein